MPNPPLNVGNHVTRVGLIPASVKVLGYDSELDDKVAGEIFGLDLAAFFAPQPKQRILVIAHDDPGVGAADKVAAVLLCTYEHLGFQIPLHEPQSFDSLRVII